MTTDAEKRIMETLDAIKSDLDMLKERVVDMDLVLTDDDLSSLDEAERDFKTGKTKRL